MSLKGFKRPDGSLERIHTDVSLSKSNEPADAAAVKAKDEQFQAQVNTILDDVSGLDERVSTIEYGSVDIISDVTQDWLDEHVDPFGSAAIVDDTLQISGAAADSRAVGLRINAVLDTVQTLIDGVAQQVDTINGEVI